MYNPYFEIQNLNDQQWDMNINYELCKSLKLSIL